MFLRIKINSSGTSKYTGGAGSHRSMVKAVGSLPLICDSVQSSVEEPTRVIAPTNAHGKEAVRKAQARKRERRRTTPI